MIYWYYVNTLVSLVYSFYLAKCYFFSKFLSIHIKLSCKMTCISLMNKLFILLYIYIYIYKTLISLSLSLKNNKLEEVLEDTTIVIKTMKRAPNTVELHSFLWPLLSTSAFTITSLNSSKFQRR